MNARACALAGHGSANAGKDLFQLSCCSEFHEVVSGKHVGTPSLSRRDGLFVNPMDPASSSGHGHTIATALDLRRVPSHTPHPAVIQGRRRQKQGPTVMWSGLVGRV